MINIDLDKINNSVAIIIVYVIVNVSLCSFCIYTYDKELFVILELSKIILLSLGVLALLMIINLTIAGFTGSFSRYLDSNGYLEEKELLGELLIISMIPLYLDAFNGAFSVIFSFKKANIIFPLATWIVIALIFNLILNKREKDKKSK